MRRNNFYDFDSSDPTKSESNSGVAFCFILVGISMLALSTVQYFLAVLDDCSLGYTYIGIFGATISIICGLSLLGGRRYGGWIAGFLGLSFGIIYVFYLFFSPASDR